MKKKRAKLSQNQLLAVFSLFLVVLLGSLTVFLINNHKSILSYEEKSQADLELALISEFVQDSLIRHDYAETRDFLENWARIRVNVISLTAHFANGFRLLNYESENLKDHKGVTVKKVIHFGDNYLKLVITQSTEFKDSIISRLKNELLLEIILVVFITGLALWYILKRYTLSPMEQELLESTEALAESEKLYKSVAANIPNGAVMIFGKDMVCHFAEGAKLSQMGVCPESAVGKKIDQLFRSVSSYKIISLVAEALLGNQVSDDFENDGKSLWVHALPLESRSARADTVLVLLQDMSSTKRLMDELDEARVLAELANKAKSEFLANMSHEIRTPMNAILGYCELLKTERDERSKIDYIEGLSSAGKRLLSIINEILDLSKIESGKLSMTFDPVSVESVVKDAVSISRANAEEKGLELRYSLAKGMPEYIFMDQSRLYQILLNLTGNALKFTSDGYVEIVVKYNVIPDDFVELEIRVKDTGTGVSDDQKAKIFESFVQQDGQDTRKFGGTGLGLTISRKLTEMMGGELSVEDNKPCGTIFSVSFSRLKIAKYDKTAEAESLLPEVEFEPATVLVVDGVESNRVIIKHFLKSYSLTVIEAEKGAESIDLVNKLRPDLVLMDVPMPVIDYFDAVKKIKGKHPGLPVIAVTASANEKNRQIEEIMDGYVSKPFSKTELVSEMIKYLPYTELKGDSEAFENTYDCSIKDLSSDEAMKLKDVFSVEFAEVMHLMINDEVADFALKLKDYAASEGVGPLEKYADELYELAKSFKVQQMDMKLRDFKELIY